MEKTKLSTKSSKKPSKQLTEVGQKTADGWPRVANSHVLGHADERIIGVKNWRPVTNASLARFPKPSHTNKHEQPP